MSLSRRHLFASLLALPGIRMLVMAKPFDDGNRTQAQLEEAARSEWHSPGKWREPYVPGLDARLRAEYPDIQQRFDDSHAAINSLREREGLPPIDRWVTLRHDRPVRRG